ncbi:MAG: hypothetical protein AB7K86_11700 [Rhodospirillales bacterium]
MSAKTGSKGPSMGPAADGRSPPSGPAAPRRPWRTAPVRLGPWDIAVNWRLVAILAAALAFWAVLLAALGVI